MLNEEFYAQRFQRLIHLHLFTDYFMKIYPQALEGSDHCGEMFMKQSVNKCKLEALRERRPPWPRQLITPILPTVKMLSLGEERLPRHPPRPPPLKKKKKKVLDHYLYATTIMVVFCSFTHLRIPRSPPKFNQFFIVLPRTLS